MINEEEIKGLNQEWAKTVEEVYKKGVNSFITTSRSGIPTKPVYTPLDIKDLDYHKDLGNPGFYPYTRGAYPLGYQAYPWLIMQLLGFESSQGLLKRIDLMAREAEYQQYARIANMVQDTPTYYGVDCDHPMAKGLVGRDGVCLNSMKDYEDFLKGVPLDKMYLSLHCFDCMSPILGMFIAAAEKLGYAKEKLRGNSVNPFKEPGRKMPGFPPEVHVHLVADGAKYCCQHMPLWNTVDLEAYEIAERGANPFQEIAIVMAYAIAVIEEAEKLGLKVDDIAPGMSFHYRVGNDLFEEAAKLRAARKVWAKVLKERFKAQNPKSYLPRIFAQTAGSWCTRQQPLNNIVRGTIGGLAAVLGGVNGLDICPYDEAVCIPTDEAVITSIRTQQILLHESGAAKVTDPLAGSYYVEYLTSQIEERAWEYLKKIDEVGGWCAAIKSGLFQRDIESNAIKYQEEVSRGERVVVGVNRYVRGEEEPIPSFQYDPLLEEKAVSNLKRLKQERDNNQVRKALDGLRQAAVNGGEILSRCLEAAEAYATFGEMMGVLKEVYGWGFHEPW